MKEYLESYNALIELPIDELELHARLRGAHYDRLNAERERERNRT